MAAAREDECGIDLTTTRRNKQCDQERVGAAAAAAAAATPAVVVRVASEQFCADPIGVTTRHNQADFVVVTKNGKDYLVLDRRPPLRDNCCCSNGCSCNCCSNKDES